MRVWAAILAAGRGERFGADKTTALLRGKPVWRRSFEAFLNHPDVDRVGVVCSPENHAEIQAMAPEAAFVVLGGSSRQESSQIGAQACDDADAVLIHDAARPLVSMELITRVINGISHTGAAAPGVHPVDTLRIKEPCGYRLIDRDKVLAMQTPQGALREHLLLAHRLADREHTDELGLLQAQGIPYEIVEGEASNFKVTNPEDLRRAEAMIGSLETRTGLGYDVHAFSLDPDRPLVLGGITFEERPGLEGHSDADVVLHAAVDALLGAAALGDIGQHFPNTDPRWKGEPSIHFLRHARQLLAEEGWHVVHVDIAVIAERPKIMWRAPEMRAVIAEALEVGRDRVSIKATTNEGLGSIGRGEGISAFATATISR